MDGADGISPRYSRPTPEEFVMATHGAHPARTGWVGWIYFNAIVMVIYALAAHGRELRRS